MSELRIYNRLNCSLFDALGHNEPAQTMGLGYALSQSPGLMKEFLNKVLGRNLATQLLRHNYVVHCEKPIKGRNVNGRADIVITFTDKSFQPMHAVIVEAKSINAIVTNGAVQQQVQGYASALNGLGQFNTSNITLVTLTSCMVYQAVSKIVSLTWGEVIDMLVNVHDSISIKYYNYLISIK